MEVTSSPAVDPISAPAVDPVAVPAAPANAPEQAPPATAPESTAKLSASLACPYGPQSMNKRISARQTALKPHLLGPRFPPVYPTLPRQIPQHEIHPQSMRMHPKGFRVLSTSSPLERNMVSYFRLPPQPPRRDAIERQKLRQLIDLDLRAASKGRPDGVVLDGFMMLEATGVQDPVDATTVTICDSSIVGAVADDLNYFTNVTFADFGENSIPLADLLPLSALQTLHLHCNTLKALAGLAPGAFPKLHTLNLSFNQIEAAQLGVLSAMPLLERLDLSSNSLGTLPSSFRHLRSLRQLALENNRFKDPRTLLTLGDLPKLEEVNLNFNSFGSVPHLLESGADDGDVLGDDPDVEAAARPSANGVEPRAKFPALTVLGLGANQFVFFEDLYNLVDFPALQRVVLWGNPIEKRAKDAEILCYELGQRDVQVVMESPIPAKKSAAAFYANQRDQRVVVPAVDGRGLPRGKPLGKSTTVPQAHADPRANSPPEPETGGSFFMTQSNAAPPPASNTSGAAAGVTSSFDVRDDPRATPGSQPPDGASTTGHIHRPTRIGRTGTAGSSVTSRSLPSPVAGQAGDADGRGAMESAGYGSSGAHARLQALAVRFDATLTATQPKKSNSNIRGVMTELRRMLRQPLPQLNRPRFAAQLNGKPSEQQDSDESDPEL